MTVYCKYSLISEVILNPIILKPKSQTFINKNPKLFDRGFILNDKLSEFGIQKQLLLIKHFYLVARNNLSLIDLPSP